MGSLPKLIMTVMIAILSFKCQKCETFSVYNVTIQRQPQKTFEVIEVMLPQSTQNPVHIHEDNKEFHPQEEPRYEIFIKPNKNVQDSAGGRKIKIFVESDDYSNEKQFSNNSSRSDANRQKYKPVPLTIRTENVNTDKIHHDQNGKANSTGNEKYYTSKSVHIPNNTSVNIQKANGKIVHTLRDIPKEVAMYGDDYLPQQNEEREKRNKYRTNKDEVTVLTQKRAEGVSPYLPENIYKNDNSQIYRSEGLEQTGNNTYVHVTEKHFRKSSFESQPSYNRGNGVEKVLVFEPNSGISVTHSSPARTEGSHSQTTRPIHDLGYDETSTSSGRRVSDVDQERTDHGLLVASARKPGRNVEEKQPSYYEIQNPKSDERSTKNEYSRRATSYGISNGRESSDEIYSSDRKTSYNSGERYQYSQEPEYADVRSTTRFPYGIPPNQRQNSGGRIVRQGSYTGFPESFPANVAEFSRPSSFEGSELLPVSPCENILKYTSRDTDRWYAEIIVTTDEVLTGMRLDIILDRRADLMTAVSSQVKSQDNIHFTVLSLKKTLVPRHPERVEIMVKFNADGPSPPVPHVKTIDLNGRIICPSGISTYPKTTTTRRPTYAYPIEVQEKRTTERSPNPYNRPIVVNEYGSVTRRTTSRPTITTKKTILQTDYMPAPNIDAYESPDHSRIPTLEPVPNHHAFVDNKPSGLNSNDNRRPSAQIQGINPISNGASNNQNLRPNDREKRISCGMSAVQPRPLITNGQMTSRGQWPWHAALYKNEGPNLTYACGGSLVTERHVITAAHCVTRQHTSIALDPKFLLVYLGKYNLRIWTENGMVTINVSRVTVHPSYNVTNFRSDIAVLTLANKVDFTDFIRPVCLWDKRNTFIDDIVGLEGVVVGWGLDETKQLSEELKQAKMPVVDQNVCLWSYPEFYPKFTYNNTYCAGFKNGTSVCNGDSGGGMFFPIKINKEERWFLRGLVSLSPSEKDVRICDTKHYVVFSDTAKYLPWLEDVMSRV